MYIKLSLMSVKNSFTNHALVQAFAEK